MKKIFFAMCAAALIVTACEDDSPAPETLEIVSSQASFSSAGGSGIIELTTSESGVTAVAGKSWIHISSVSTTTVEFTVDAYDEALTRVGSIIVTASSLSEEIPVLQEGSVLSTDDLELDGSTVITLDPTGEEDSRVEFVVTSDAEITISIQDDATWVSCSFEGNTLVITGDPNFSVVRTAVITVTQGWKTYSFTVSQNSVPLFASEYEETEFDRDEREVVLTGTEYLQLAGSWFITTDGSDWITYAIAGETVTVTLAENTSGAYRTGSVYVVDDEGVVCQTFTFSQKIYSYNFFLGEWTMNYNTSSTVTTKRTITVTADVEGESYTISGCAVPFPAEYVDTDDLAGFKLTSGLLDDMYGSYYIRLAPYYFRLNTSTGSYGGTYSVGDGYVAYFVYNMDESSQEMPLEDGGTWTGYEWNSICLRAMTSTEASTSYSAGSAGLYYWPSLSR